jgi:type VI protein secretion system component Hcp
MSTFETKTTDTGTAGEPAALTDKDLEVVIGGATTKLLQACANGTHVQSGRDQWIDVLSFHWGS